MIRFIYAEDLNSFPKLRDTMFRDRAYQFKTRLKWDVSVNSTGFEIDQYDTLNPLYVIWEMEDGTHGGSMRLLPTTGQTMVNDYFLELNDGVRIESPLIWECTRFCLSPRVTSGAIKIAAALQAAGCKLGLQFGLSDAVGVFDARMVRIYRRLGHEPTILGTTGEGKTRTSVGLWAVSEEALACLCENGGISKEDPQIWFDESFPIVDPFVEKEVKAAA